MTLQERSALVLAFARVLYVNGQATDQTVDAASRLGGTLGLRAEIMPRWGELQLRVENGDCNRFSALAAFPTGVDMDRVASTMRAIDRLGSQGLAPSAAAETICEISVAPAAPTWQFTLAAGMGAVALAVLFGVQHLPAAALIFASAAAGAALRRALAKYSSNVFLQPFSAALVAGIVGALAVRYQLSSSLRLVAVCPCMILVPGPHLLNGALDLVEARIHLGAARLLYSGLVISAISTGLLLGLAFLGVSLPIDQVGRAVPLWQDVSRCRRRRRLLQHLLLHAAADAGMACDRRHARPRPAVGDPYTAGLQRRDWRPRRLCLRRGGPHASRAPSTHALCRYRFRRSGVDDPGRLPVPNGQRPAATCRWLAYHVGALERDGLRRHDCRHDHPGDELRPHCSEDGHRSPWR